MHNKCLLSSQLWRSRSMAPMLTRALVKAALGTSLWRQEHTGEKPEEATSFPFLWWNPLIPSHRSHSPFTAGTRLTTQITQETLDHVQTISIANVERAPPFLLRWVSSEIIWQALELMRRQASGTPLMGKWTKVADTPHHLLRLFLVWVDLFVLVLFFCFWKDHTV